MKNKRMMSAAIAVLMAGSLAACGGSTTASSTADSTPASTASLPLGVYELPHGFFLPVGFYHDLPAAVAGGELIQIQ